MSWSTRIPDLLPGRALEYYHKYIRGVENYVEQYKALDQIE